MSAPLMPLLVVLLGLASAGPPVLRLRDPGGSNVPILEGSNVTLECVPGEPGGGARGLAFQKYAQELGAWRPLEAAAGLPSWLSGASVRREAGSLLLTISGARARDDGAYRCLDNATGSSDGDASASAQFDLRVEYLRGVFLSRLDSWCATVGHSEPIREGQDMELRCWADASQEPIYEWSREGEDWVVASNTLALRRVSRGQAGTYTCRARHPSLAQLQRSRSLRLVLTEEPPGWAAAHGLALAVAVPTSLLLLLLAAFSLLIIRHRAAAKVKAPREKEPGQRSPIYKGSLESVPSTAGDTQPLVM